MQKLISWNSRLAPISYGLSTFTALGLLALGAGSGELYGWPRLASLEGTRILWLLIPFALLQIPVIAETQRIALLTGRSFFGVLSTASRFLGISAVAVAFFSLFWLGGWLSGSAAMIAVLLDVQPENIRLATNILTVTLAIVIGWPLMTKKFVARYVSTLLKIFAVAAFSAALISLLLLPDKLNTISTYVGEMFTPHFDVFTHLYGADRADLILAIIFLGLGGWLSALYSSFAVFEKYGREKNSGDIWIEPDQGTPASLNLLTNWEGGRLKKWYRHLYVDTSAGLILNMVNTALLTFLSISILFGAGIVVGKDYDLLGHQASFFEPLLGSLSVPIFILIGSAFLLDTWVGLVPLMAKGFQEGLQVSIKGLRKFKEEKVYQVILTFLFIQTVVTSLFAPPGSLIRFTAILMNSSQPFIILLLIYMNYFYLPKIYGKEVRPGWMALSFLILAFIVYSVLTAWYFLS